MPHDDRSPDGSADAFGFGIEEEFFLADAATGRSPAAAPLDAFHEAAAAHVEPASHELLKGQVEVQSGPDTDFDKAHEVLRGMRAELSRIAGAQGLTLFAAGSHPLAVEDEQHTTQMPRYRQLEEQLEDAQDALADAKRRSREARTAQRQARKALDRLRERASS